MKFYKKYLIAIAAVSLGCIMALPVSSAQARVFSNVMQLDTGGAYLGIQMEDVNAGNLSKYRLNSERGAIVRSVVKGSPAEAAGLEAGDIIVKMNSKEIGKVQEFEDTLSVVKEDDSVRLTIFGKDKTSEITLKMKP